MNDIVTPGERIGEVSSYNAGPGTYESNNHIYSSIVGKRIEIISTNETTTSTNEKPISTNEKTTLSVVNGFTSIASKEVVQVGDRVIGKISKVSSRQANVDIVCIGEHVLRGKVVGIIRIEDVREKDIDSVVLSDFFKDGDIVKAVVISIGDSRAYYLSTAQKDLGVLCYVE